jgi:cell division septal protein FtsQ
MFFNRNKSQKDSRVRFQHRQFKRQLQDARDYKRPVYQTRQTVWQIFFSKIGLGTIRAKIFLIIIIALAIYLAYIPNVFTIKEIQISGATANLQAETADNVKTFFKKNALSGQNNLLLLSKNRLADYLLENNKNISRVDGIRKKFPNRLIINLQPRIAQYLVEANHKSFIVANDGLILEETELTAASSTDSQLIPFTISQDLDSMPLRNIFGQNLLQTLQTLNRQLPQITSSRIKSFAAGGPDEPDLDVHLDAGYKILFDSKSDLDLTLERLKILLSQISPADLKKLYYLDMRIKNRGYVCFKNTACAVENPTTATTTIPSL